MMSRGRVVWLVMKKEFLDLSRDRRTLAVALVLPLVVFPLFFGLGNYFSNPKTNPSPVLLVNRDTGQLGAEIADILARTPGISLHQANVANITAFVSNSTYDVGLLLPPDLSGSVASDAPVNITLVYDQTNGRAATAVAVIGGVVASISQRIVAQRLQSRGLTQSDLTPIGLSVESVRKLSSPSLVYLSVLFPTFLLYFTFLGSFYFIVDDISGEKERRSLEALFTLPPSRSTFFLGKFASAFLLSMLTAALGLVGTQLSLNNLSGPGFSLPPASYPVVFAITMLASLSLTSIGFCASTFAKNVREAQQYLGPIFLLIFIPMFFTFGLPPQQVSHYAALPVVGYVLLMRDVVLGTATPAEAILSVSVNLAVLFFLVWLAVKLLNTESVILRAA